MLVILCTLATRAPNKQHGNDSLGRSVTIFFCHCFASIRSSNFGSNQLLTETDTHDFDGFDQGHRSFVIFLQTLSGALGAAVEFFQRLNDLVVDLCMLFVSV
jgi:hypothetical protein